MFEFEESHAKVPCKLKTHIRGAISALLTPCLFICSVFLSYEINVRCNIGPKKSLRVKLDI